MTWKTGTDTFIVYMKIYYSHISFIGWKLELTYEK